MSVAYKYCDLHGINILKNLELKVTPPNQFNDPFEFTAHLICSNPVGRSKLILKDKEELKGLHQSLVLAGRWRGTFKEYRKYVKTHRNEIANDLSQLLPVATAETQREMLDNISKTHGVVCFSNRCDSILMWGHYCDKHRGLAIGFDSTNVVFRSKSAWGLHPVSYVRERTVLDIAWKKTDPRFMAFERQLIFSKNDDWSYEEELRMFGLLSFVNKKTLSDGSLGYFLPIPPQAFVSVTMGARCSSKFESEIRSALKQQCLSHVKIDRAVLHDSKFALNFV